MTNFVSMCLGASSNKCLSTILHRSVASLRGTGVMYATCDTQARRGQLPVEMHHAHLAGFDFSKKLLCVGNFPATNREILTRKFTGTRGTCTARAPAPSALAAPPDPNHSYKHFSAPAERNSHLLLFHSHQTPLAQLFKFITPPAKL